MNTIIVGSLPFSGRFLEPTSSTSLYPQPSSSFPHTHHSFLSFSYSYYSIITLILTFLSFSYSYYWMAFVDLEKAFNRVPHEVLWWALRHIGVEEWMVNVIKSLYEGVTIAVKRNGEERESFEVKVGGHQGWGLSPTLFNIVIQGVAENFNKGF